MRGRAVVAGWAVVSRGSGCAVDVHAWRLTLTLRLAWRSVYELRYFNIAADREEEDDE